MDSWSGPLCFYHALQFLLQTASEVSHGVDVAFLSSHSGQRHNSTICSPYSGLHLSYLKVGIFLRILKVML